MKKIIHIPMQTLFLLLIILFSCKAPVEKKKIGVQLWSVRNEMKQDPGMTINKLAEMGYTYIETAGYEDGKFYGMEPEAFKQMVEDAGMIFLSSHTGQDLPDESNYVETMDWWKKCIAAHKKAGVKYIVQPWMGSAGYDSLSGLAYYCDYFNDVGTMCKKEGIKFGYHNHDKEFGELEGQVIYDYMLKNTEPEHVFFQLDLYWIYKGGKSALDYFNNYPGRFTLWHVKDKNAVGGSGEIDFKPIFDAAEKAGMKYYIVECEGKNENSFTDVKNSIDYLQNADFTK